MDIYEFEGDIESYRKEIIIVMLDLFEKRGINVSEDKIVEPLWDIISELDKTLVRIKAGKRMKENNKNRKHPKTYKMMDDISKLL